MVKYNLHLITDNILMIGIILIHSVLAETKLQNNWFETPVDNYRQLDENDN